MMTVLFLFYVLQTQLSLSRHLLQTITHPLNPQWVPITQSPITVIPPELPITHPQTQPPVINPSQLPNNPLPEPQPPVIIPPQPPINTHPQPPIITPPQPPVIIPPQPPIIAPPQPPVIPNPPQFIPIPIPGPPGTNPATPTNPTTEAPVPILQPPPSPIPPVQPPALPIDKAYGAFGQICSIKQDALCKAPIAGGLPTDTLRKTEFIQCDTEFSCCLCAAIECFDCTTFSAGNAAIYGVKAINIQGRPAGAGGAEISCFGEQSCSGSKIVATNIRTVAILGDSGATDTQITITNPVIDFNLFCTGMGSCAGSKIELSIPAATNGICNHEILRIGTIKCSAMLACNGMDLTIRNDGCSKVMIENIECTETDSCTGANFNFIGDIDVANCNLGPSGHLATGSISKCYNNLGAFLCQEPSSCMGITKTLTNPNTGFSLQCGQFNACFGAQITLNFNSDPWFNSITGNAFRMHTSWIDGFKFSAESSGEGAVFTINNQQRGGTLTVESIECTATNSCKQTIFILGKDVDVKRVLCFPGTCDGCLIKIEPTDPGTSCAVYAT